MANSGGLKMARIGITVALVAAAGVAIFGQGAARGPARPDPIVLAPNTAISNPYRMLTGWPHMWDIKMGAAIGLVPDGKGGVWMQFRSNPAIVHLNSAGNIVKRFEITFSQAHGFCQDRDGNFWAEDSGPFGDAPDVGVRGNQTFKYSPDGKLLLTLGQAGIGKLGTDTFLQPVACRETPDGNILIADGHWPRPSSEAQDGDRLMWFTRDGKFIKEYGKHGRAPGDFMGPHGLAFDSKGRLFVADRSNNRVTIFDKDMNVVDNWTQFGRPSGIWILKDDTLIVSDSESNHYIGGPQDSPEGGTDKIRNPGWKNGIWIGSAKDGSVKNFISETRPEGLAADELGNIFAGLTADCALSKSGSCLQKYVKRGAGAAAAPAAAAPKAAAPAAAPAKK
jgi:hypothetical protein